MLKTICIKTIACRLLVEIPSSNLTAVASPVSCLTVLASLPDAHFSLYVLLLMVIGHVFACCCTLGHIRLYDVVDGESLMPPLYFRICPRSSNDLALTCFLSLFQCLLLGCLFGI